MTVAREIKSLQEILIQASVC